MFQRSKAIYSDAAGLKRTKALLSAALNEMARTEGPMAKPIQKSPTISGQLEPLLKAAALRRLQQEPARVSNTKAANTAKASKSPAKKRKKP
jgi:hypothetical protein